MNKELAWKKCKELSVLFFFGLLAGCIYFHVLCRLKGPWFFNEWGIRFDPIMEVSINKLYIRFQNYHIWFLGANAFIYLLGFFTIGRVIIEAMAISSGVLIGAMETLLLLTYDFKSLILFWTKIVLIMFLEVVVFCISLIAADSMSSLKKMGVNHSKKYIFIVVSVLFLHAVYIFACSYVNCIK